MSYVFFIRELAPWVMMQQAPREVLRQHLTHHTLSGSVGHFGSTVPLCNRLPKIQDVFFWGEGAVGGG